jgi:hypothetical protein
MRYSKAASNMMIVRNDHKRVRFNDDVTIHEDSTGPTTFVERHGVWYSYQELIDIKKDVQVALHFKDSEAPVPDYDWRGLETHLAGAVPEQTRKQQDFVSEFLSFHYELLCSEVLLHEQDEPLRQFSASKSKQSCKDALRRAKEDELTAKKVYRSMHVTQSRRSSNDDKILSPRRKSFMTSLVKGFRRVERNPSMHKQIELRSR